MRTSIICISLFGSFFIFSQTYDWFGTFLMFTLFGVVPGMSEPLGASQMLTVYMAVFALAIVFFSRGRLAGFGKSIMSKRSTS